MEIHEQARRPFSTGIETIGSTILESIISPTHPETSTPLNDAADGPSINPNWQFSFPPTELERVKEFNTPHHETYHLMAALGIGELLGINLLPHRLFIKAPENQHRNSTPSGGVEFLLPIDKNWGKPHPLLVGAIAAAPLLAYEGGIPPRGIKDDSKKMEEALIDYFGWEGFEEKYPLLLSLAHAGIQKAVEEFGHQLIDAVACHLMPQNGEDIEIAGSELLQLIEQEKRALSESELGEKTALTLKGWHFPLTDAQEILRNIERGFTDTFGRIQIIDNPCQIIVENETDKFCPQCGQKSRLCSCSEESQLGQRREWRTSTDNLLLF